MNVTVVGAEKVSEFKVDVSHIVTVGCSFTYCQGLDDKLETGWPAIVAKHFNSPLTNLAMPGVGNDTIHRKTYEYIFNNLKFENSKPLVIIAWSQIDRHEQWYQQRQADPMFNNYHLVSKPDDANPVDLYQKVYLQHYDERNFYRKTLLNKLSLINLFKSFDIPYLMTNYMSLVQNESIKQVDREFSNMSDRVHTDPYTILDLCDITRGKIKLPCGHETAENMIPVSSYVIESIEKLHSNINFKNDVNHLRLIDFIKTDKYHKKFPEWCHFSM